MTAAEQPETTALHPATRMGAATLGVADLARSIDFYTRVLGLHTLSQDGLQATLGAGQAPLLHLQEIPGAQPQPPYSTGLYHVAILLPTRADLGRVLINLSRTRYQVSGFSDHLVSEAIYLDDPDGNGLELYRDRPREQWNWDGSSVRMASDPIDLNGIVAEVEQPDAPFTGMPQGTTIGHMHLRVGDVAQAEAFYGGLIGFDVVARWPGALFISAGGYHHHLGLNTWHSRGAPPAPENAVGLRRFEIIVPDATAQAQVLARLESAAVPYQRDEDSAALFADPWHNHIALKTA